MYCKWHHIITQKDHLWRTIGINFGPLLFLLYINDLEDYLDKTTHWLYADDIQIFSASTCLTEFNENLNHGQTN